MKTFTMTDKPNAGTLAARVSVEKYASDCAIVRITSQHPKPHLALDRTQVIKLASALLKVAEKMAP